MDVDLLIVGAGMAGLTAGARAVRDGLSVLVVEIGPDVGGSARFAGYAWTAPSHEIMDQQNPHGDPALKRALVDGFADGISWIRSIGVEAKDAQPILSFGRGHQFDTNHYLDTCRRRNVTEGYTCGATASKSSKRACSTVRFRRAARTARCKPSSR